jgi:hypothetical protein
MAKGRSEADSYTAATRRGRPRSAETTNAILQSAYTLMATTGLAATFPVSPRVWEENRIAAMQEHPTVSRHSLSIITDAVKKDD